VHCPWGLQIPPDEHTGVHAVESISTSENWAEFSGEGRCCVSGIESHRMTRFEDEAADTITTAFDDSASD